jgi:radical SAM protein with 4Fe4S-binding SPASM domain
MFNVIKSLFTRSLTFEFDRVPYKFKKIPLKKLLNYVIAIASAKLKTKRPWGYPIFLQIEPSSNCNLKCPMCPVTDGINRSSGNLNFSILKKIIDQIGEYIFVAILWDWGEPFLNPDLFKMINYARLKGIKLVCSTNGQLIRNVEHAEKIVDSGLDSLIFAIDGITQQTYQQFRKGGKLNILLQGIEYLIQAKERLNSKTPIINLRTVVTRNNEDELPSMVEWAKSLGVDIFSVKTFDYFYEKNSNERVSEFIPQNKKYQRFIIDSSGNRVQRINTPCKALWIMPDLHSNGHISMCWRDYNEKYFLGDLNKSDFKDMWFGNNYNALRDRFKINWKDMEYCKDCTFAYEGGSCDGETIAEIHFFRSVP